MAPMQLTEDSTHAQRFLLLKCILALLTLELRSHLDTQFRLQPSGDKGM